MQGGGGKDSEKDQQSHRVHAVEAAMQSVSVVPECVSQVAAAALG